MTKIEVRTKTERAFFPIRVRVTERAFFPIQKGGYVELVAPEGSELDCIDYRGFDRQGGIERWAAWLDDQPGILSYKGHYEGAPVPGNVRPARFIVDEFEIYNVPTRAQKNWS